jgi:hypothetical protein
MHALCAGTPRSAVAISARGHTNRGRVKQKGAKRAELLSVGALRLDNGWYNAGGSSRQEFRTGCAWSVGSQQLALLMLCLPACLSTCLLVLWSEARGERMLPCSACAKRLWLCVSHRLYIPRWLQESHCLPLIHRACGSDSA